MRYLQEQASLLNQTHDAIFVRTKVSGRHHVTGIMELRSSTDGRRRMRSGKSSHELLRTILPIPLEELRRGSVLRTGRWDGELRHLTPTGTEVTVASRYRCKSGSQAGSSPSPSWRLTMTSPNASAARRKSLIGSTRNLLSGLRGLIRNSQSGPRNSRRPTKNWSRLPIQCPTICARAASPYRSASRSYCRGKHLLRWTRRVADTCS